MNETRIENSILDTWAKATTARMQPGGDLYMRPKTRSEMTAPLAWHEIHMAVAIRYGELADGTVGQETVHRANGTGTLDR